jgi:succinoglycan biosynthesis transport protein ExoP
MNQRQPLPPPPVLALGDVYYIIFRHKWKILLFSAFGLIAATCLILFWPVGYRSEAKLFIKYVVDSKSPSSSAGSGSSVRTPDERGDTIINTEEQLLTSFDLAKEVAQAVGPDRILMKPGGATNLLDAAAVVQRQLSVDVPKNSTVLPLIFEHRDPVIARQVLEHVIDVYYKLHFKAHRQVGVLDDFLTTQTDQLHSNLLQTGEALKTAKTSVGVISLEESKRLYSTEISKIRQDILQTEVDLAEAEAAVHQAGGLVPTASVITTNNASITNLVVVDPRKVAEYRRVCSLLEALEKKDADLSLLFTPESTLVKENRAQIAANEKIKKQLEQANPGLLVVKSAEAKPALSAANGTLGFDLSAGIAKVAGLNSKLKVLNKQLDDLEAEAEKVATAEPAIADLQRRYNLQETQYNYFSVNLEQARVDEALGPDRVSNISQIQTPTPPRKHVGKLMKIAAGILCAGFAAGIGLAFLIELVLDQSLRRPGDVELKTGLRLFMSIPRLRLNEANSNPLLGFTSRALAENNGDGSRHGSHEMANELKITLWDPRHILRPFYDALRDRLITFFEVNEMRHKPKLVAVTSCQEGSGVSTMAAGLAASLSETGEGNVLLVDMNGRDSAAHYFYRGELACGLDDALEKPKREDAMVQQNLYVVSETKVNENLPNVLPKRFKNLVPRLKASDYDYIIFDMPPVDQISITPRLAKFMDLVLMVVESEKVSPQAVKRASSLLTESKVHVGVVLNKSCEYVPRRLRQGLSD